MNFIRFFKTVTLDDVGIVGGKNAALGQMIHDLPDIRVPLGFAITAPAYWYIIERNNLLDDIKKILSQLSNKSDIEHLKTIGSTLRELFLQAQLPEDLKEEILQAYQQLSQQYRKKNLDVAVRSSATAEDLPGASFAGQQETYLHIRGTEQLLMSYQKCLASLFTDRAILYRVEKGFDHLKVAMSVGIQKMVRSDLACSGVAFSLDTETGFKDIVMINAAYGLGETIVQGAVNPDEYRIFKTTLLQNFKPIIKKFCGNKKVKLIYDIARHSTIEKKVVLNQQKKFCLNDQEIIELATTVCTIEQRFSALKNSWSPMDIEWAKDGKDGLLYIIQARPETVHAMQKNHATMAVYNMQVDTTTLQPDLLVEGQSIGQAIVAGKAQVLRDINEINQFKSGNILITTMTNPDWVPIMKQAAAIITDQGGRTCHAAIVSRELGIPAVVGTEIATQRITSGSDLTIDNSSGKRGLVYQGNIPFEKEIVTLSDIKKPQVVCMINNADPDRALTLSFLPYCAGIGLARTEFIIANTIKLHPMACIEPEKITNKKVLRQCQELASSYKNLSEFFVDSLAQGIGTMAAAFYPRTVIVRFSDFKSNEYRNLLAGSYFEPQEENPMLGLRGASRYYHPLYAPAFALECAAMKKARDEMGLRNIKVMIPFVRNIDELLRVQKIMAQENLIRHQDTLEIVMMCELPANVLSIEEFAKHVDGFSIGSNDLTQCTLAVDRDSALVATLYNEQDESVKKLLIMAIEGAHREKVHIGICGQAPSDYPEIAELLIKNGIDSISLNADVFLNFLMNFSH